MSEQRVRPGRFGEIGVLAWLLAHGGGRQAGTEPMNLFLVLGRHKRLFRGWLFFAGSLMPGGILRRTESELVILRVAHVRGSAYEHAQHVRIGRRAGLSNDDIDRVSAGPDAEGWTPRQRAMLAVVDELLERLRGDRRRDRVDGDRSAGRRDLNGIRGLHAPLVALANDLFGGRSRPRA